MTAAEIASVGGEWLLAASLQAGALALAVLAADVVLKRFAWPRLRLALHLLVVVKLLVPPGLFGGWAIAPNRATLGRLADAATGGEVGGAAGRIAFALWGVVAAGLLVGTALRDRRARRRIAGGATVASARSLGLAQALAAELGLRRVPEIVESDAVPAPIVFGGGCGWGRRGGCVVLPRRATGLLADNELEDVLLHEMTHLRRGDPLCARFCAVVARLFWFHPLIWIVVRRLAGLRELACDATVAAGFGGDPARLRRYRRTLLHAAARRFEEPLPVAPLPMGALGWSSAASIIARLDWLDRPRRARPRVERRVTTLVIAVAALVALPTAGTAPADPLLEMARATVEEAAHGRPPPGCLKLHYSVLALVANATSSTAERR